MLYSITQIICYYIHSILNSSYTCTYYLILQNVICYIVALINCVRIVVYILLYTLNDIKMLMIMLSVDGQV